MYYLSRFLVSTKLIPISKTMLVKAANKKDVALILSYSRSKNAIDRKKSINYLVKLSDISDKSRDRIVNMYKSDLDIIRLEIAMQLEIQQPSLITIPELDSEVQRIKRNVLLERSKLNLGSLERKIHQKDNPNLKLDYKFKQQKRLPYGG